MKTRIRIVETMDGKKKYYVEEFNLDLENFIKMLFIPIIGWAGCIIIYYIRWRTINIKNEDTKALGFLSMSGHSIFSTLIEAQTFRDKYMEQEKGKLQLKIENERKTYLRTKVKKITIIK